MGDIDQALARAYARRVATAAPPSPPPPHFAVDPTPRDLGASATLEWPRTVLALERGHGERFERLAEILLAARDGSHLRTLLFTSCHRSEGRTTLVLALARALARRPGRTLLVDADLAGPMLARSLGLRPRLGLDDVIEAAAPAADAIIEAPDDHLSVLPLRAPVARPREFLAAPAWLTTMARLRREFDLVLIDGSPLFAGLSEPNIPRAVDASILVHNRTLTGPKAVLRAREAIDAAGLPLLGLAETFV